MTPAEPDLVVSTPAQHRALGHPTRHRLLNALRGSPATTSQLARRLQVHKGSIAHHLKILLNSGMVRQAEQRQVRGGTETYFEVAFDRIVAPNDPARVSALFAAITPELVSDEAALLHLRHLHLGEDQAQQLRTVLEAISAEPADSDTNQPIFGVLVGMYRRG